MVLRCHATAGAKVDRSLCWPSDKRSSDARLQNRIILIRIPLNMPAGQSHINPRAVALARNSQSLERRQEALPCELPMRRLFTASFPVVVPCYQTGSWRDREPPQQFDLLRSMAPNCSRSSLGGDQDAWRFDVLVLLIFSTFLVAQGTPASAQATRTWVSGVGDDANPCSRTAPCKTFPGAISKTAAGGEINVLDPGGFGPLRSPKRLPSRL